MAFVIIAMILSSLAILLPAQQLIHIFQQESYKRSQFFKRLQDDLQSTAST